MPSPLHRPSSRRHRSLVFITRAEPPAAMPIASPATRQDCDGETEGVASPPVSSAPPSSTSVTRSASASTSKMPAVWVELGSFRRRAVERVDGEGRRVKAARHRRLTRTSACRPVHSPREGPYAAETAERVMAVLEPNW